MMNESIKQLKGSLDLAKMDHAAFNSEASKNALDLAQAAYDAAVTAEAAGAADQAGMQEAKALEPVVSATNLDADQQKPADLDTDPEKKSE